MSAPKQLTGPLLEIMFNDLRGFQDEERLDYLMRSFSYYSFWIEVGAAILILPRMTGKTTACIEMAKHNSDVILCYPNRFHGNTDYNEMENAYSVTELTNKLLGTETSFAIEHHLLVDEFMSLSRRELKSVLSHKWNKISMVSSVW